MVEEIGKALVPAPAFAGTTDTLVSGSASANRIPAIISCAGERALLSFVNYFTAEIPNPNTRAAYLQAWRAFGKWAEGRGLLLDQTKPFHLAAYREDLQKRYHVRSVKQHLSALRKVFDQLVIDQVLPLNPAATVRGPKFSARHGTTPILTDTETRKLFDSIDTTNIVGLRDKAILAVLIHAVARVSAVTGMQIKDFYLSGRKWKVRLHEKGGKLHEVFAHHNLVEWMHDYIEAAGKHFEERGQTFDKSSPLFRSSPRRGNQLTENGMDRRDVYRMIRKRALAAGVNVEGICCHSFRATGITLYMENGGHLDEAQKLANHSDPRTTKLYDRSGQTVSLDEIEKIRF